MSHKHTLWTSTLWPGQLLTLVYSIDWLCMRVNADFVAGIVWTKSTSGNPGWQVPRWNIGCIFVHFCKLTINRRASLQQWLKPRDKKNVYISSAVQMSTWSWKISICLLWLHFLETFAVCALLEMVDDLENKTIEDGGITLNFWIIKVHTFN